VRRTQFRQEMIRVAVHGSLSERELTRLAEDLRDEVDRPALGLHDQAVRHPPRGSHDRAVGSVDASLRPVSFSEVANAIRASSVNLSSGQVRTATGDVQIRARNLADTEQDFDSIIVRQARTAAAFASATWRASSTVSRTTRSSPR
jgi:hypothetical protein